MWRPPTGAEAKQAGASAAASVADAELLVELADQSRLGQLARLDLAAGKFPQARHGAPGRAPLQQHPPFGVDQRRRHHGHCRNFFHNRLPWKEFVNGMPAIAARAKARMRAMRRLRDISRDQKGATAVEYGLIVGLIFLAIVSGVALLAATTTGMWNNVSTEVRDAQP